MLATPSLTARSSASGLQRFLRYAEQHGMYSSAENLAFYADWLFDGIPLRGRSLLDIGCGNGLVPIYARCRGARRAVGLEPERDGAARGMLAQFEQTIEDLGLDGIESLPEPVEEFATIDQSFDLVSLCQVINHLDEEACAHLHHSREARDIYMDRLHLIRGLLKPGGWLVITDCGRVNLFRPLLGLGLPHPFAPTIDWQKHQEPGIWITLLRSAGFQQIELRWRTPNRLRRFSGVLSNGLAARCLTSEFRLTARRP